MRGATTVVYGAVMLRLKEIGLFLLGCLASILFFVTLTLHTDHTQILIKAFKYIDTGVLTHFGNAATHVGYVPGTLTTVLSAIPMKIYFSPYSAMAIILLFHIISWALLSKVLKNIAGPLIVIDFLLIYWLSPWRVEQSELYNPAYVFLFSAIHIYSAMKSKTPNFWMSFLNVVAIGLCMQLHLAATVLGVASLLLIIFKQCKVNWWGALCGVFAVILSLVPYFISLSQNQDIALSATSSGDGYIGRNLLYVYPILKAIVYWFRYGAIYYGRHIFSEINFLWITNGSLREVVSIIFHSLKWILAVVSLYWSFKVQRLAFLQVKQIGIFKFSDKTQYSDEQRLYLYGVYLFLGVIISVALSPVEMTHWHLILCMPYISMVIALGLNSFRKTLSAKRFKTVFLTILFIFLSFDILGALGSRSHSYESNFHEQVLEFYKNKGPW